MSRFSQFGREGSIGFFAGESGPRTLGLPWPAILFAALWLWAIWACAEHWRGNPNYSYGWVVPVLALAFGLRRYTNLKSISPTIRPRSRWPFWKLIPVALGGGALVFALEFARQSVWHPQIILQLICGLALFFSFALFFRAGGLALVRAEIFPLLFFVTAMPWPARLEQPITSTLMRWVAAATAEILHWLGVEAQSSGGAIVLHAGLVGITEACSGIRSLQAGIMFGLAVGEWFMLTTRRRYYLLGSAILLAFLTNLARTIALCLQAEWHGVASVAEVHDFVGNICVTALVLGIWLVGKILAPSKPLTPLPATSEVLLRIRDFLRKIFVPSRWQWAPFVLAGLIGLVSARVLYSSIEARDQTQLVPFFTARADAKSGDRLVPVPSEIWNELRPSSGEYLRRESLELPLGAANFYHFFWKPSPWNRFVLVHRPDICMPGVGWQSSGPPEAVEIDFNGRLVRCHAFRFERAQYRALQLWGVWRNGDPVPLDYDASQVLGETAPPASLQFSGKRRSATEIVACSVVSTRGHPPVQIAVELLRSVFEYKPQ